MPAFAALLPFLSLFIIIKNCNPSFLMRKNMKKLVKICHLQILPSNPRLVTHLCSALGLLIIGGRNEQQLNTITTLDIVLYDKFLPRIL